ncbi:MAG: LysE family translocator [Verrucomicrobiae bacterium]|nr:LysE family translocator [Verrucomicrobiae bacterium]
MTEIIIILLVTQVFAMMSPGPDMILIVKNTLGQTTNRPAVFTILGIGLGLAIHISLSIGGLSILLTQSPLVYKSVRYAGAAYLAYLGIKALISTSSNFFSNSLGAVSKTGKEAFREGFITNLSNPKVTLYILSLFTQLIPPSSPIGHKLTYGGVLVIEAIVVWLVFAALIGLPGFRKYSNQWSHWMDRIFGILLLGIALSVVIWA